MANASVTEGIRRLASDRCVPCNDAKPFPVEEASKRLKGLPGWILQLRTIQRAFRFKSYLEGLDFAYSLGKIVELQNHHPDLFIGWRRVQVVLSSPAIALFRRNDFVLA